MQKPKTLILRSALPVLLSALLLTACAPNPQLALPPAPEPVPIPAPPVGEADCDGVHCLSDRQAGQWMADVLEGFREANARLVEVREWIREAGE
jgi:hypothetical protein